MKIRRGDTVQVVAGKEKGRQGRVDRVLTREKRIVVEGVNMVVRHVRPTPGVRQAGRVQRESPLHVSNVMLVLFRLQPAHPCAAWGPRKRKKGPNMSTVRGGR